MSKEFEVSVVCITYNQGEYIKAALDSILAQETTFDYEVIIHDDASTDTTRDILETYKNNYPNIIRIIYEEENQYSKGIDFFLNLMKNETNGKYIALCEGDDFWIGTDKLQMQRDAMENDETVDMCVCWGCTTTEDGLTEVSQIRPLCCDGILELKEVILGGGQYLVTAGLFFRKSILDDMKGLDSLDYSLQIRGALRGGIKYIDKKLAIYRRYSKGSWTNDVLKNDVKLKLQWEKEKKLLNAFDKETNYKFHNIICERMKSYVDFATQLEAHKNEIIDIINCCNRPCYIWGMGRRGKSFESFLYNEQIYINGICDAINADVGAKTEFGNLILKTSEVLNAGGTILVSNAFAYEDLVKDGYGKRLIRIFDYMPWG